MTLRASTRAWTCVLALAGLPWALPRAWAQAAPAQADSAAILAVRVNGLARGEFLAQRTAAGPWLLRVEDLPAMGLRVAPAHTREIEGRPYTALQDIDGLQVQVDERTLSLDITAPPALLERTLRDAGPPRRQREHVESHSAFLNWAAEQTVTGPGSPAVASTTPGLSLATEAGLRRGGLLLVTQGSTVPASDGTRSFVRLMSTASYDRPQRLQRWSVGDFFTRYLELGDSLNLGGIALSRHDALDPYTLRYPLGMVQGQASLPSEVDIYVDGQRVRTERVPPGDFAIRDLLTPLGARSVQVQVRDPYGRVQQFENSFYTSDQLLRVGLQDYQYAVGALRRRYGLANFDYGPPAGSAYHRWGLDDALTAGFQLQGQRDGVHGGPTATLRLGPWGILGVTWSASHAAGLHGHAASLRYDYQSARWALGLAWRRDSPGYVTLSQPPLLSNRRQDVFASVSRRIGERGTLSLSRSVQSTRSLQDRIVPAGISPGGLSARQATVLGYGATLPGGRSLLRLTLAHGTDWRGPRTELNLGWTLLLDGPRMLAANAHGGGGSQGESLLWSQPLPACEGWGHELALQRERTGSGTQSWHGLSQLNASAVRLRGEYSGEQDGGGTRDRLRLAASGSLAWLEDGLRWGRPIDDAFALVKVGELPGIPVTTNGTPVGVTDAHGQVFIPRVGSNYETEFSIDARMLPIDQSVPRLQRKLVLPERGGAIIDFSPTRTQGLVGRLMQEGRDGLHPLPRAVVHLHVGGRPLQLESGAQGELYLENLPAGRHHGQAQAQGRSCEFDLEVPTSNDVLLEVGDIPCRPAASTAPTVHEGQNRSFGPK